MKKNVNAAKNAAKNAVENAVENTSDSLKAKAEALINEAKRLKDEAKKAAKEAKEAAKKAKALTSRPIRAFYFEVRVNNEFVAKSDVHYCAEKVAIDALIELRADEASEIPEYTVYKVMKDDTSNATLVEKLRLNDDKQIVIE